MHLVRLRVQAPVPCCIKYLPCNAPFGLHEPLIVTHRAIQLDLRHHQHSTAQHSTAQHSTAQHSTAQHSTAQHSTAQRSAAQHSTAQHSTKRRKTASMWCKGGRI
jgi:hypothetical protein